MLKEGIVLGERYQIISRVGSGGMADVYKAKDQKLDRLVAVKVLKPEFREDTNFVAKFGKEAQAAAGLSHPNVSMCLTWGRTEGFTTLSWNWWRALLSRPILQGKANSVSRRPPVSRFRYPWDWRLPITGALSTGM